MLIASSLLNLLRKRLEYTCVELGGMWPGEGDLFHQEIRQDLDKLAVAALVQLWLIHELGFVQVLIRVLVGDGKLEMQS